MTHETRGASQLAAVLIVCAGLFMAVIISIVVLVALNLADIHKLLYDHSSDLSVETAIAKGEYTEIGDEIAHIVALRSEMCLSGTLSKKVCEKPFNLPKITIEVGGTVKNQTGLGKDPIVNVLKELGLHG